MAKVFEDYFSELQADMISICLENVNGVADEIYLYCSYESGMIASSYFYCINGQLVERHKLNDVGSIQYDVSPERQKQVFSIIIDDMKKMIKLCQEYKREMPTEMKMIFDVKTRKFKADYSYEFIYTNIPDKIAEHVANEWFEEVKKASEDCA
ncbi:MAG: DUF600 family protein [Anaerolineaceae bacterium]|nr:DUF600 family protein [Anaerolineaceae bacterium]